MYVECHKYHDCQPLRLASATESIYPADYDGYEESDVTPGTPKTFPLRRIPAYTSNTSGNTPDLYSNFLLQFSTYAALLLIKLCVYVCK